MATSEDWEVPQPLRPRPESLPFDLPTVYRSVVLLHTETSEDAYTASILGTDRIGHGVVIRSAERKLVLTIGKCAAGPSSSDPISGIELWHSAWEADFWYRTSKFAVTQSS